jgi:hypothetical protein
MRRSDPNITIVVPCYNEGENLPLLLEAIEESLAGQSFELILLMMPVLMSPLSITRPWQKKSKI